MPQHLEAVGIALRDDRQIGVVFDQVRRVDQRAIHTAGQRGLGEPRSNRRCNVRDAHRCVEGPLRTIGQSN